MRFEFTFGKGPKTPRPSPGEPFRLLVLGDFDGRSSRGLVQSLAGRRPTPVDIGSLESFFRRAGAQVDVSLPGAPAPARITPAEIDHFHPDQLVNRVELFAPLHRTRQRLLDRSTFASAAAEVRAWSGAPAPSPAEALPAPTPSRDADSETLARLLGRPSVTRAEEASVPATARSASIAELIRPIVAEHVLEPAPGDAPALVASVDAAIAGRMRALLHASAFQALESTWRGLDFLLRHVETSESLQVFALNASKAELLADLSTSSDLERSDLFRILVESTVGSPGADPWAMVLGLYPFGLDAADVEALARVAALGQAAGAPFVSCASASLMAAASERPDRLALEKDWAALRARPESPYLALAGPRFLLRLPYGKITDPVSAFAFEELGDRPDHEAYLWGSPAIAIGVLFAQMFAESEWEMSPDGSLEIGDLPVHVQHRQGPGGEPAMMPCAEAWLPDSQAEALFRHGMTVLQSIRGRDAVRIARVRSLGEPVTALAGRWR